MVRPVGDGLIRTLLRSRPSSSYFEANDYCMNFGRNSEGRSKP